MTRLAMPQLGESVTEGTIVKWLKNVGDHVAAEEPLVEIETEKVNVEIPSPWAGVLTRILVPEGETVAVGTALAELDEAGGQSAPATSAPQAAQPAPAAQPAAEPRPQASPVSTVQAAPPSARSNGNNGAHRFSPAVMRLAQEHGIDPSVIPGSGFGGRVTRKDIVAWLDRRPPAAEAAAPPVEIAAKPSPAEAAPQVATAARTPEAQPAPATPLTAGETLEPLSATRRAIARHMLQSVQTAPHAWMAIEVDVTRLVRLREAAKASFREREGVDLTYLPFMIKAVVAALKEHPRLNASWRDDAIVLKRRINIGFAVDVEEGLTVPVIHDADQYSIAGLARRTADLAARARARRLELADVEGGTFTVDNTGVFGSVMSAPIINQPQAAIVTMEAIVKRPVVIDDAIAIRSMLNCCISFDHRIADGGQVGRFMQSLKQQLERFGEDTTLY